MSKPVILAEGLGKTFRLGATPARYATLRDALATVWRRPGRGRTPRVSESFWALKDVSFEVRRGEVVGVIGRNGAGKSTLLKILSRITAPTEGTAEIRGRIGSLLEVGTGFHPELTGRENVFLNGAILGMRRAEIERKFDEIVAFAEVERFIDTPVKHYSSGMYLRLAFAVAAHLEPEVLLVDEVLAVGDLAFQRKCLGKMGEVADQGRTVLFVSHNMGAVAKLCQTGIVLDRGRFLQHGPIHDAIRRYTELIQVQPDEDRPVTSRVEVRGLEVAPRDEDLGFSGEITARFVLCVHQPYWRVQAILVLRNSDQVLLVRVAVDSNDFPRLVEPGAYRVAVHLPALWLASGQYSCHVKVLADEPCGTTHRYISDPLLLPVTTYAFEDRQRQGSEVLAPRCSWTVDLMDEHPRVGTEILQDSCR